MDKAIIYYCINDNYGLVGYGFKCGYCGNENNFVDERYLEHECEHCKKTNKLEPISR